MSDTARFREIPLQKETSISTWLTYVDGALTSTYNVNHISFETEQDMTDVVSANYAARIAMGEIINHSCLLNNRTKHRVGTANLIAVSTDWAGREVKQVFSGSLVSYYGGYDVVVSPPFIKDNLGRAQQQALARIDDTPYAMLEDVLEIRETLKFLRSPLSSLVLLLTSFRKDVIRKARKERISRLKASANLWLTWRFAVMPLFRSIMDINESIGKDFEFPARRTSRGKQEGEDTVTELKWHPPVHLGLRTTRKLQSRAAITYEVSNPAGDFRHTYGLRNKDIPLGLWNIIPLSFMVDRVVDISSTISGVVNLSDPNVTIRAASTTVKKEDIYSCSIDSFYNKPEITSFSSDVIETKVFVYLRNPWYPSYTDTMPSVNLRGLVDSVTKVTDLIALLVQLTRF